MSLTEIVGASGVALLCGALFVAAGDAQEVAPEARLAALDEELASLEREIGLLEDTKAIKRLQRAYGYYMEEALWDEVLQLFADDATLEFGRDGVYAGKERIREYLYALGKGQQGLQEGQLQEHLELMPVLTLADDGMTIVSDSGSLPPARSERPRYMSSKMYIQE